MSAVPKRAPSKPATKQAQREVSIEALLESALSLFVTQGYRATNLEQIAAAAQLSKGSVYFYFGSKEAVLLELLNRLRSVVVDEAVNVAQEAKPSAVDQLVAFLHHQSNLGVTHRNQVLLLILMSLEFSDQDGAVRAEIGEIYERLYQFVESLIRVGQRANEFRADLNPREVAAIIMANHDGTFLEWYRRPGTLRGPALVAALRGIVLNGLLNPKPTVPRRGRSQ